MRSLLNIAICLCGLTLIATPARSQDGFQLPNLNPFKKPAADEGDVAPQPEEKKPFRFPALPSPPSLPKPKLPTLPQLSLPKFELPAGRSNKPAGAPSAWTRLNRGTKEFFAKTKSALMPWSDKPASRSNSGSGSRVARRPSRPTLLPSLFGSTPEEPEINSVNDYLALPRPTP